LIGDDVIVVDVDSSTIVYPRSELLRIPPLPRFKKLKKALKLLQIDKYREQHAKDNVGAATFSLNTNESVRET
jgi:hypothetical protein